MREAEQMARLILLPGATLSESDDATLARALTVIEGGMGFGFLALVIGYLPVLYQSFSRRELNITLLDARAGSPPSAEELLRGVSADRPGGQPEAAGDGAGGGSGAACGPRRRAVCVP